MIKLTQLLFKLLISSAIIISGFFAVATPASANITATCNNAVLSANVITGASSSIARFAYSETYDTLARAGGIRTPIFYFRAGGNFPFEQPIQNLSENTTYYYQLRVSPVNSRNPLTIRSFTTPACGQIIVQPPVIQNPTVNISASPTSIAYNGTSTITWNSTNATSCSASGGVNGWSGSKSTSGTFYTGALTNNETYNITCSNSAGSANGSTIVNVDNNQNNLQPSVNIYADDSDINSGDSTRIHWDSTNADYCSAGGGTNGWSGSKNTSGSFSTGSLNSDETYRITCYNNNNSDNDSVTVYVNNNNNNNNNNNEPSITTENATNISTGNATLNGWVNGNNSSVRAWFEYGTNTNLGSSTSQSFYGSGSSSYTRNISGLYSNTTYYFRAVAENSQDTVYGNIFSFNTSNNFYNNPVVTNYQPTVVISTDQTNIPFNSATNVRWNTTNATSCYASGGSSGWAGVKNIGLGFFNTGLLSKTETYTITCSNNIGSSTDSATVNVRGQIITTSNPIKPTPTSLVLMTSSVNHNQSIVPTLDNTRPHPGDEINYTVGYQNIGTGAITNLILQISLPQEVSYVSSNGNNPNVFGNNLVFNLGTLQANNQGTIEIKLLVRSDAPAGTNLNFPATLSYVDPSNHPQSVSANTYAQIWSESVLPSVNGSASLGANVFSAGFLPTDLFGWLLLIILMLLLIFMAKYLLNPDRFSYFRKQTVTTLEDHTLGKGKKTTTTTTQ